MVAWGLRSTSVSWLPLILIIREHDSSIWVSSSQRSRRLPSQSCSCHLHMPRRGKWKPQHWKTFYPFILSGEKMDWSGAEAGQRKSMPVDSEVIRVLLTWTWCRGWAKECKIARKDIKVLFGSFVMYCLFFWCFTSSGMKTMAWPPEDAKSLRYFQRCF